MIRLALIFAFALLATPVLANGDDFAGLYRGINVNTGSMDTVSITPSGDGLYAVALHATAFEACDGPDKSATTTAVGTPEGGALKRTDGKATCTATGTVIDLRDGEYTLSEDESLLTLRVEGRADITYHRISD